MRLAPLSTVLVLLAVMAPALAGQQTSLEYDVKAAFVLNFVRYVEWPSAQRTPPLQLCVLQRNPFGNRLEAVVNGEQWHGGTIRVRVVNDMRAAVDCHVLYVPASAADRFSLGVSAIAGLPILTVGEHAQFMPQGGIIHLFLEQNKVRFSINQRAADAVGLAVSSRLLRLARTVIGTAGSS
jgi:hypothetical protein